VQIWGRKANSLAPLAVSGEYLQPIHYHSPVASAQVKSCLLLAGLLTEGKTTDHGTRFISPITVNGCCALLANIEVDGETNSVTVTGYPTLTGQTVIVPGIFSSAAFWLVAGAIVPNSELLIENVGINPTRTGVLQVLQAMGADITLENQRVVTGEPVADSAGEIQSTTGNHDRW
jgi:3-phosphoshikimate 1-carboxyvinyltransferase